MNDALQVLLDFVEGRMSAADFEQRVYNDAALESLLKDESLTWRETYVGTNPFDFLIELDYRDPGGVLSAQGAVEMFLKRRGISFTRTKVFSEFYDLLVGAQPKWLLVDAKYVAHHILPDAGDLTGKHLKEWLKTRLLQLFRYSGNPPEWIQSPARPISKHGPMYFLGQIKILQSELFHDEAACYVFLDAKTGTTKTVIQVF